MIGNDERQFDVLLPGALADAHPSARHGGDGFGQAAAPPVVQRRRGAHHDRPPHFVLRGIGHQFQHAQIDTVRFVQAAHLLHRAVQIDGIVVPRAPQFRDDPLRLAQRIGTDQHAPVRVGGQPVEQFLHLLLDRGVGEDRQAESRLGDEDVAGRDFERRAGGIGAAFVIAGADDPLARMFEQDLRTAQHVPRRDIGRIDAARQADRLPVFDRHRLVRDFARIVFSAGAIAQFHDGQRFGRGDGFAVAAPRVIGVAVRDERLAHFARRVDPRIGGDDVDAPRFGLYPGEGRAHSCMERAAALSFPVSRSPYRGGTCRTRQSRRRCARPAGLASG